MKIPGPTRPHGAHVATLDPPDPFLTWRR